MLDDTGREPQPAGPAPTVESLTKDLERAMRVADLFRQQRDNAVRAVNDLQVELAECRFAIEQLQGRGGSNA